MIRIIKRDQGEKPLQFGSIQFQRSSADQKPLGIENKFRWMPHPASQRAKFMNHCLLKCYKSRYGVKYNNPQDFVRLFHDQGRRQYDIQEHVSKITLHIDAILSTSNPGAAGKFYTADYVLVPADLLILRANITKLSELLENISDIDIKVLKLTSTPCFTQRPVS